MILPECESEFEEEVLEEELKEEDIFEPGDLE